MPLEMIEELLLYFRGRKLHKLLWAVAPFMNGEPLLDERLPRICTMVKDICDTVCVIDTNGTEWRNREFLLHPNLKLVRFTISAITPETYMKVHGRPYFYKALSTFYWFLRHKRKDQIAWLHFITTKNNQHEVEDWVEHFEGVGRTVFPLHRIPEFHVESERGYSQSIKEITMFDAKGNRLPRGPNPSSGLFPCPCWGVLAVSWRGEILQCVDLPYSFNYGKVEEVDLLEAWRERNRNKLDNAGCNGCSQRFKNYKKVMDKYIR